MVNIGFCRNLSVHVYVLSSFLNNLCSQMDGISATLYCSISIPIVFHFSLIPSFGHTLRLLNITIGIEVLKL